MSTSTLWLWTYRKLINLDHFDWNQNKNTCLTVTYTTYKCCIHLAIILQFYTNTLQLNNQGYCVQTSTVKTLWISKAVFCPILCDTNIFYRQQRRISLKAYKARSWSDKFKRWHCKYHHNIKLLFIVCVSLCFIYLPAYWQLT